MLRQQPSDETDIGRTALALDRDHDLMHGHDGTPILRLSPAPMGSAKFESVNGYHRVFFQALIGVSQFGPQRLFQLPGADDAHQPGAAELKE